MQSTMGILDKLFGSRSLDKRLFGVWVSDIDDEKTKLNIGDVKMTFTYDGKLIYDAHESDKIQRINMIFWTEGEFVFTDQPSHPNVEKTKFSLPSEETLILEFGGVQSIFRRTNR